MHFFSNKSYKIVDLKFIFLLHFLYFIYFVLIHITFFFELTRNNIVLEYCYFTFIYKVFILII